MSKTATLSITKLHTAAVQVCCAGRKITTAHTIQGRDLAILEINSSEMFGSISVSLHSSPSKPAEATSMVLALLTQPCKLNTCQLWSTGHRGMPGQTCPEAREPVTETIAVTTGQMGTLEQAQSEGMFCKHFASAGCKHEYL